MTERAMTIDERRRKDEAESLRTKAVEDLTKFDIDKMSGDVYASRVRTEPDFVEKVNKFESERAPRPRGV